MIRPVLVTGFGAFPGVIDNPTAALARAVHGRVVCGVPVVGEVLPVTWQHGPRQAIERALQIDAALVIGLGVAVSRTSVCVETMAYRDLALRKDALGALPEVQEGPDQFASTLECATLASALGASLSSDPGRYVCNAWLYQVGLALDCPVGFVHVPVQGLAPARLLAGIAVLLDGTIAR